MKQSRYGANKEHADNGNQGWKCTTNKRETQSRISADTKELIELLVPLRYWNSNDSNQIKIYRKQH